MKIILSEKIMIRVRVCFFFNDGGSDIISEEMRPLIQATCAVTVIYNFLGSVSTSPGGGQRDEHDHHAVSWSQWKFEGIEVRESLITVREVVRGFPMCSGERFVIIIIIS